jgi:hypothetical protein
MIKSDCHLWPSHPAPLAQLPGHKDWVRGSRDWPQGAETEAGGGGAGTAQAGGLGQGKQEDWARGSREWIREQGLS